MSASRLQPPPLRVPAYVSLLMIPPLVALAYAGVILTTAHVPALGSAGLQLSPVTDPLPLVASLVVFIIGYCIFVGLIFKDTISILFHKKPSKQ